MYTLKDLVDLKDHPFETSVEHIYKERDEIIVSHLQLWNKYNWLIREIKELAKKAE